MTRSRRRPILLTWGIASILAMSAAAGWAAVSRPVVFLDGDPAVAAVDSEEILLAQRPASGSSHEFGSAVAFGDVNGDGLADAVVGQRARNRVFVYLGAQAPTATDWFADPNAADIVIEAPAGTADRIQQFGFSAVVLDLDGDGFEDLIVGAPFSDPGGRSDAGLAFAILGGGALQTGLEFRLDDPPPGVVVTRMTRGASSRAGDLLGFALAGGRLGSLGETVAVVTARGADASTPTALPAAGAAHMVLGSAVAGAGQTLDLDLAAVATFQGSGADDAFGESVSLCDVDGSGDDDLIAGAIFGDGPANAGLNRGEVFLFLGENVVSGLHLGAVPASAADLTIFGGDNGDDLGYTVACGDLNGDGRAEILAGAIFADSIGNARPTAGEAYVFRGRMSQVDPNNPARRELIDPKTSSPQLPMDLSFATNPGDPAPDATDLTLFGATTADQLGFSLGAGDLDGDGTADLLAGARRYDRDQTRVNVGATYILIGSAALLDPGPGLTRAIDLHEGTSRPVDVGFVPPVDHLPDRVDAIVVGASRDDHSSWAVAAGDLNGDGGDEVIIGAIGDLAREPGFGGEAYILSYADTDTDGASNLLDQDNDNDGISDQDEAAGTFTGGVPTDPFDPDTDSDQIQDGTELGLTCLSGGGVFEIACDDLSAPFTATDPNLPLHFVPDQDPSTQTDPLDRDSDDDGLGDGAEDGDKNGAVDPLETDPSSHDTDGDLIFDGTESGITAPMADTDVSAGHFVPDADGGASVTDPADADTDGDGLDDGVEDADRNGAVAGDVDFDHDVDPAEVWAETDPTDTDTDRDGVHDGTEIAFSTDPLDQDTDDDGIPDGCIDGANGAPLDGLCAGLEGEDIDGDGLLDPIGESNPRSADTDGDGLTDGVECGLAGPGVPGRNGVPDGGPGGDGTDTTAAGFRLDADSGASRTDPTSPDSDLDLIPDNVEDADLNGAVAGDTDLDNQVDPGEVWTETDAANPDTDEDGIADGIEDSDRDGQFEQGETDPLDQDTDDDGLPDGCIQGANGATVDAICSAVEGEDRDGDGVWGIADGQSHPLEFDSDGDGLPDGTEAGVPAGGGVDGLDGLPDAAAGGDGTWKASANFKPDSDPTNAPTNPGDPDTDDDGLPDGYKDGYNPNAGGPGGILDSVASAYEGEDLDLDGAQDPGETDPVDSDSDTAGGDGVSDGVELGVTQQEAAAEGYGGALTLYDADETSLTDPLDGDSDEDGLSEGQEDANGNGRVDAGESDPNNPDTDGDLLPDGLERGLVMPQPDTDLMAGFFVADADPATTTNPTLADTDGGGAPDGGEDANGNGRVDIPEQDPNDPTDDDRTGLLEFTDVLNGSPVTSIAAGATLFIRLDDDTDENVDPNLAETVSVTCASDFVPADTETVTLTATGPDTGVFVGSIPTGTAAGASGDGTISVAAGGTIDCTYADDDDPPDQRVAGLGATALPPPTTAVLRIDVTAAGVISWTPEGSALLPPATRYNLYRGVPEILAATGVYTQESLACGLQDAAFEDAGAPAVGSVVYYLVAGTMDGAEGSLGNDSLGRPRSSTGLCGD